MYFTTASFFSPVPANSLFGVLRLAEYLVFGYLTAVLLRDTSFLRSVLRALSVSLVVVILLTLWQFFEQRAIGGVWYWLGERRFSAQTPGIANASLNGSLVLRPYATFPHPNVLAGFLVLAGSWYLYTHRFVLKLQQVSFYPFLITALTTFGIVLSMSRTGIVAWALSLSIWLLTRRSSNRIAILLLILCVLVVLLWQLGVLTRFSSLSFGDEAVTQRSMLLKASWEMFLDHPLLGVGLRQFLPVLPQYLPSGAGMLLQPVHNVFVLWTVETGLVGLFIALLGIGVLLRKVRQARSGLRLQQLVLLMVLFLLGFMDHYLLTLHQGSLIAAFIVGSLYSLPVTSSFHTPEAEKYQKRLGKDISAFPLASAPGKKYTKRQAKQR